jgi:hypothetical protein
MAIPRFTRGEPVSASRLNEALAQAARPITGDGLIEIQGRTAKLNVDRLLARLPKVLIFAKLQEAPGASPTISAKRVFWNSETETWAAAGDAFDIYTLSGEDWHPEYWRLGVNSVILALRTRDRYYGLPAVGEPDLTEYAKLSDLNTYIQRSDVDETADGTLVAVNLKIGPSPDYTLSIEVDETALNDELDTLSTDLSEDIDERTVIAVGRVAYGASLNGKTISVEVPLQTDYGESGFETVRTDDGSVWNEKYPQIHANSSEVAYDGTPIVVMLVGDGGSDGGTVEVGFPLSRVPEPPSTGTKVLAAVDGVIQWFDTIEVDY